MSDMKMFWLSFNQAKVSRFRNEERIFLDLFRYRLQPENKKEFFFAKFGYCNILWSKVINVYPVLYPEEI